MNLQNGVLPSGYPDKKRAAIRVVSDSCFKDVANPGRFPTTRLYHSFLKLVKPFFAVCLLILIIFACFKAYGKKNPSLSEVQHRVTYGETLWGIAQEYKPDGMSMGAYMDWVYSKNGEGYIYPGDVVIMGVVSK